MLDKNLQQFLLEAEKYDTVPLCTRIVADTKTPIQLFQLFDARAAFILESKDWQSPWANYSFIGLTANYFLVEKKGFFFLENKEGEIILKKDSLVEAWEETLMELNVSPTYPNLPFPGGAVGYFSFESYAMNEPKISRKNSKEPDVHLIFCESILVFDHEQEELMIIHMQEVNKSNKVNSYESGKETIANMLTTIRDGEMVNETTIIQSNESQVGDVFQGIESNYEKEDFLQDVEKIKKHIQAGEIEQAVLSQRFDYDVQSSGLDIYRVLRKVNPSPYLYYLRLGEKEIIGSSPERQMKVDSTGEIEIHPIAGTRPRGKTKEEDEKLEKELLSDHKERSEHEMLVQLAKKDIENISENKSIYVRDKMTVAYFSHVMHIISKVYGQLKKGCHPFQALLVAHPAGTVSGAPKAKAVEIVQGLEKDSRGVYAGAIAYCSLNGAIDSCIAIRTVVLRNGRASVQAGAGIVKDSEPEKEYEETKNKARGLLYALKTAEERYYTREGLS